VDSTGATLDFLLSAKQDAAAAKRFLAKALGQQNHPAPHVINTDGHAAYPPAIAQLKSEGTLDSGCQHRPVPYLKKVLGRTTGPSSGGLTPARASVLFGLPGARWPATR
jgi:IS6 family transposase